MTTGKQQPATSQGELADDLIAELSKLMAQSNGAPDDSEDVVNPEPKTLEPKPPEPSRASAQPFKIRLPGDPSPQGETAQARPVTTSASTKHPTATFDPHTIEPATSAVPVLPRTSAPQQSPTRFSLEHRSGSYGQSDRSSNGRNQDKDKDEADPIADLIAAELAAQPVSVTPPAVSADPESVAPEDVRPTRRPDSFPVAPVFGMGGQRRQPEPQLQEPSTQRESASEWSQPSFVAGPDEVVTENPPTDVSLDTPAPMPSDRRSGGSIDDLESLIGGAVRARPEQRQPARVEPSPALRSLATPVARKPEPSLQPVRGATSAEDAILAAAAATGAQVSWIDPHQEDTAYDGDEPAFAAAARPRRNYGWTRQLIGPGVAMAFLAVAGFGLYSVLGGSGASDTPAPLLTADAGPTKEVPEAAIDDTPARQSVVFNEIAGESTPAEDEQIVSRDQSDDGDIATAGIDPISDEGVVNRKVRTVTVRPDGTIVGGDTAMAGASVLPVDRPQVPAVPGSEADSGLLANASAFADPAGTTVADLVAADGVETATPLTTETGETTVTASLDTAADTEAASDATLETALLVPGESAVAVDAAGEVIAGRVVPVPLSRIDRPSAPSQVTSTASSPINAVIDTPAATTQPVVADLGQTQAAAPATPSAAPAPAYIQLSSQRSQEAAQQTASDIQNRFGSLFNGTSLEIQRVDLGERGVYFRVRLPAQSAQSASQICNTVKANGGDCFTI